MWCCVWCEYVIEAERVMCAAAQTSDSDLKANMRRSVARSVENRTACSQLSLHVWSTCIFVAHHGFCKVFDEKLWKPCVVPIQPVLPSQYAYLSFSTKAHFPLKAHLSFSNTKHNPKHTRCTSIVCNGCCLQFSKPVCIFFIHEITSLRIALHSIYYNAVECDDVFVYLYTYTPSLISETCICPLMQHPRWPGKVNVQC